MSPLRSTTPHRLGEVAHFAGLPPKILDKLAEEGDFRQWTSGQEFWRQGDKPIEHAMMIVLEAGTVTQTRSSLVDADDIVLAVIDAPTAFGELSLIDGDVRHTTIKAVTPVSVRLLDYQVLRELLEAEDTGPIFTNALLRTLTTIVRRQNVRHALAQGKNVKATVAWWLLFRAVSKGDRRQDRIEVSFSRTALAGELGVSRREVHKALKDLVGQNLIISSAPIVVILDPLGLVRVTGDDVAAAAAADNLLTPPL